MAYPPTVPPANRVNSTPQADNHPDDHNTISSALSDIINEVSTHRLKNDGSIPSTTLRLTSTSDVTLTSTAHAFQIGPSTGVNLAVDTNEIQARNNNAAATLALNQGGGTVTCGGALTTVGTVNANSITLDPGNVEVNKGNVDVPAGTVTCGSPSAASSADGSWIRDDGNIMSVVTTGAGPGSLANISLNRVGAQPQAIGGLFIDFNRANTITGCGSITIASGTSVAYNTNSDPRLKELIGPITDAPQRVQGLAANAFRGRWIADGDEGQEWDMLSSHDIEDAAPYAVTGDRDAVDVDGHIIAQQVNYSSLVPLLVAALGDALARIEILENR